jgi:chromosome segregation ATPase
MEILLNIISSLGALVAIIFAFIGMTKYLIVLNNKSIQSSISAINTILDKCEVNINTIDDSINKIKLNLTAFDNISNEIKNIKYDIISIKTDISNIQNNIVDSIAEISENNYTFRLESTEKLNKLSTSIIEKYVSLTTLDRELNNIRREITTLLHEITQLKNRCK